VHRALGWWCDVEREELEDRNTADTGRDHQVQQNQLEKSNLLVVVVIVIVIGCYVVSGLEKFKLWGSKRERNIWYSGLLSYTVTRGGKQCQNMDDLP
jgi:hypothetical protein